MTLPSRFFAMTYDRQVTKVEKAGLRAYREAGLTVTRAEHRTLPKVPKFASPAIVGSATVPASVPSLDVQLGGGKPVMTIAAAR
jgi:hypothetical protein